MLFLKGAVVLLPSTGFMDSSREPIAAQLCVAVIKYPAKAHYGSLLAQS